jgi:uncharacterized membrane protein HdeD (DUF308 family)
MLPLLLRKWWVILLQGILLLILGIFILNNPAAVLAGISLWFSAIVIITGLAGIISWLGGGKHEREGMSFLWSIVTFVFGLLMVSNLLVTMKTLSVIFGFWVLVSGIFLFKVGWALKNGNSIGWVLVITGVVSVIVAVMMLFNINVSAVAVSTLLGLQVFLTGISLILLSFAKRTVAGKIRDKVEALQ